jgi:hypothetical protein
MGLRCRPHGLRVDVVIRHSDDVARIAGPAGRDADRPAMPW